MPIVIRCTCGYITRGIELTEARAIDCAGCGARHELVPPAFGYDLGGYGDELGPLSDAAVDAGADDGAAILAWEPDRLRGRGRRRQGQR